MIDEPSPERSSSTPTMRHASDAVMRRARRTYRGVERALASTAPVRATVAIPRTARFMGATAARQLRDPVPGLPVPALSPAFAAQVAMDEVILALAMGPNRFPRRSDYERVSAELRYARLLFETRGWLADPRSYHRDPPPLEDPALSRGWALGQSYERLLFPSGWLPREEEPGAERWAGYEHNRTAIATVLRHRDRPRPWVVGIHGFGMGSAFMDFVGVHALRLHRALGLNVALPVLPLHGARKISRVSGEAFLGFDLVNTVHGLTQAVWDIRRIISWIRTQEPCGVAAYGVSLGGYTTALLAGIDDRLGCAIAGVPIVDFPALISAHSPMHLRMRAIEHEILDGNAEIVHQVISPLAFTPTVAPERRFIFAGLGDRLARPSQARRLWEHWDQPSTCWYAGNHVGYLWSGQVTDFVVRALIDSGFDGRPTAIRQHRRQ